MTADKLWIGYKGSDAELVRGMTLAATVLRKSLLEHVERIGCPCGSEEWLAERLLDANLHDENEES
jgi:hypothetical protein